MNTKGSHGGPWSNSPRLSLPKEGPRHPRSGWESQGSNSLGSVSDDNIWNVLQSGRRRPRGKPRRESDSSQESCRGQQSQGAQPARQVGQPGHTGRIGSHTGGAAMRPPPATPTSTTTETHQNHAPPTRREGKDNTAQGLPPPGRASEAPKRTALPGIRNPAENQSRRKQNCRFGNRCWYKHQHCPYTHPEVPECRFGKKCRYQHQYCPYTHPSQEEREHMEHPLGAQGHQSSTNPPPPPSRPLPSHPHPSCDPPLPPNAPVCP